jgi:RNA polymerase sigma factor (sigma-70 family)
VDEIERAYARRYGGFRRALVALHCDVELAHDAVQEGFARALRKRSQFRGGSLDAWLWRIVYRTALDLRCGPRAPLARDVDPALVPGERDPELAAAIRGLPPRRRLVVFLRYFADLSYAEIAEACEVSEGTVAATLAQAHAELKQALALEGVER